MTYRDRPGRPDAPELTEKDLAIATLIGRYIERRLNNRTPCVHDLLAVAAEFSDDAAGELRDVLAFYEAMRASEDTAR